MPASFVSSSAEKYANETPQLDSPGGVPSGWSVAWDERRVKGCEAMLWPQAQLMQPMIGQLARLPSRPEVTKSRMGADRHTYHAPGAAPTPGSLTVVAASIHRIFRYLVAEHHHLEIRLPKAAERRSRNFLKIRVCPRLGRKPIALQLKRLENAASAADPLEWEAAWRGTTMPALRVLDQALEEARADKRNPLSLHPDFWCDGKILSSPLPTAEFVAKVLPTAQRIAAGLRNPGRQAEDETVKTLCAVFRFLTGRDAEVRRGGHPVDGQKPGQRARGSAVVFILWLMHSFRSLLVESGAYSTWRRAVHGREHARASVAGRKR